MKIRIGVDSSCLLLSRAGIAAYTRNLLDALLKVGGCDYEFVLFAQAKLRGTFLGARERVLRFPIRGKRTERLWQEYLLAPAVREEKIAVFHGPRFFVPRGICPTVATVHDLAFKKFPEFFMPQARDYFDRLVKDVVSRARIVIVPSTATKEDLKELYALSDDRIRVIHYGRDEGFFPRAGGDAAKAFLRGLGISRKFMLFAGTVEPRKNLVRLVQAYNRVKEKYEIDLVIAGGMGWLWDDVIAAVKELRLEKNIIFTQHLDPDSLAMLYSACELFVYPSLYEGFGLPVLEAMSCGACVVTSNTSSLKELYYDASYQIDPLSVDSLHAGIEAVLRDSALRSDLREKGLQKASQFSWQKAAQETLDVYREAMKPHEY